MKKALFKFSIIIIPVVIGVSMALFFNYYEKFSLNGRVLLELENDYRLKFVDSSNYELYLGETDKIILPVEILEVEEKNDFIIITTYEHAVVSSPISCNINSILPNGEIELQSGKIKCVISGLICGVQDGTIQVGDILGTVKTNKLYIQVFWGSKKLSLDELRSLL